MTELSAASSLPSRTESPGGAAHVQAPRPSQSLFAFPALPTSQTQPRSPGKSCSFTLQEPQQGCQSCVSAAEPEGTVCPALTPQRSHRIFIRADKPELGRSLRCAKQHLPISTATRFSRDTTTCFLASFPTYLHGTMSTGEGQLPFCH